MKRIILLIILLISVLFSYSGCNDSSVEPKFDTFKIIFISDRSGNTDSIFTSYRKHDVFIMDSDGRNQINLTNSPDSDFTSILFSPNGNKILYRYVTTGASFYFIMNIDGTQKKVITSTSQNNFDASFSPDGQKIIYVSQNPNNDIIIMDINGNEEINLTAGTGIEGVYPKFSSNGKKICFSGRPASFFSPNEIFIMDRDGSNMKQLTDDNISYYHNIFSLDDKIIFFTGWQENHGREIYRINVDGTDLRKLTNTNFQFLYGNLIISPDGKKILFTRFNEKKSNIYSIDIDGANLKQLTASNMALGAIYTPDGSKIIYVENVNGLFQIFEMHNDGTNKINLSNNGYDNVSPIPLPN